MADDHTRKLYQADEQIIEALPARVRGFLRWLERPAMRWVRVPVGILLIVIGVLGFLPVVGFWMIPLGALLLAHELPFLRRPTLQFLAWVNRMLTRRKDRSRSGH